MPDFIPKTITALGGAKGIIALLIFLGIGGNAWQGVENYLKAEVISRQKRDEQNYQKQVAELAVMASKGNRVEKCTLAKCLTFIPK